jgi:hypothetical protein
MSPFPKGYERDAQALRLAIQQWIAATSESRLPDLRFHDWGTICYVGPLHGDALDHLAASADARAMLEWADERTGRRATLLMACVVLEMMGLKPRNSRSATGPQRQTN